MLPSSSSSSNHTTTSESEQKKQKSEAESEFKLIPSLPDDVALNCLARVPRTHHPTLSLVSKPFRSLLSSPLFFNIRSQLQSTEPLVYVTTYSSEKGVQLFTLHQNPNPNLLLPLPPIPCSPKLGAVACAVVGTNIYVIGGSISKTPCRDVWVLDCRFNLWQPGPTMLVGRRGPLACVVDGKIYVMGGCNARSNIQVEVLDPDVGLWVEVPCPFALEPRASTAVDDKVYIDVPHGQVVFDTRNGVWERVENKRRLYLGRRGDVLVDGILYCHCSPGTSPCKINLFDVRRQVWKLLKGLDEGLLNIWSFRPALAYVGGKLLVVWRSAMSSAQNNEIWCTQIEVNKNGDAEVWGKVCSSKKLLSVPDIFFILQCSVVDL